jgi:hypothetical protein
MPTTLCAVASDDAVADEPAIRSRDAFLEVVEP